MFFLDTISAPQEMVTLNEETSKHIVQVLRMKESSSLLLTDGAGSLLTAQIADAHKKKCTVRITERKFIEKKSRQVSIGISLLKNGNRFEWFLEKATEIGVAEIIPMLCERTEKQYFRFERLKQILVSATLQSKQVWLPVLHEPMPFSQVIERSAYATKLIAHCSAENKTDITDFSKLDSVQILIGSEGDFSRKEIDTAVFHGYEPVGMGETRLRSETAGIVAATVLCI